VGKLSDFKKERNVLRIAERKEELQNVVASSV
jgi:hypothetical protein